MQQKDKIIFGAVHNLKVKTDFDDEGKAHSQIAFSVPTNGYDLARLIEWFKERPLVVQISSPQMVLPMQENQEP
jgi:hypothetical protein